MIRCFSLSYTIVTKCLCLCPTDCPKSRHLKMSPFLLGHCDGHFYYFLTLYRQRDKMIVSCSLTFDHVDKTVLMGKCSFLSWLSSKGKMLNKQKSGLKPWVSMSSERKMGLKKVKMCFRPSVSTFFAKVRIISKDLWSLWSTCSSVQVKQQHWSRFTEGLHRKEQ